MKKIDFSKIQVLAVDGQPYMVQERENSAPAPYDFARALGNALFYGGKDIRMAELGQSIYHHEPVELTDEELTKIREFIDSQFVPFVRLSVNRRLDELQQ